MNRISKTLITALCVSGIALTWILPQIVRAIHDVCGMSTTHELEVHGLIDKAKLEELRSQKGYENFSIEQSLRSSGATGLYLNYQSGIVTAVFGLIAVIVFCVPGNKPVAHQTATSHVDNHYRTNIPFDGNGGSEAS